MSGVRIGSIAMASVSFARFFTPLAPDDMLANSIWMVGFVLIASSVWADRPETRRNA